MEAINLWARRDIFQGVECLGYNLAWSTFTNVVAVPRADCSFRLGAGTYLRLPQQMQNLLLFVKHTHTIMYESEPPHQVATSWDDIGSVYAVVRRDGVTGLYSLVETDELVNQQWASNGRPFYTLWGSCQVYEGEFEWEFRYVDWERAGPILPAGLNQRALELLSVGECIALLNQDLGE